MAKITSMVGGVVLKQHGLQGLSERFINVENGLIKSQYGDDSLSSKLYVAINFVDTIFRNANIMDDYRESNIEFIVDNYLNVVEGLMDIDSKLAASYVESFYSIAMKEDGYKFHGYVRIESDAGRRIFEVLKDGYAHKITVKIHFLSSRGWELDQVVIDKLISID